MAGESDDKELKTVKFQMMLTPSETEAIDDWMFKQRIRSRAEAIRRLCAAGLALDNGAQDLITRTASDMAKVTELLEEQAKLLLDAKGKASTHEGAVQIALAFIDLSAKLNNLAWSTLERTSDMLTSSLVRSRSKLPPLVPFRERVVRAFADFKKALARETRNE